VPNVGPGELLILLILILVVVAAIRSIGARDEPVTRQLLMSGIKGPVESAAAGPVSGSRSADTLIRTYRGRQQADAVAAFERDAAALGEEGYVPVSQSWAPGQWGCGAFLVALLLLFLLVGILIFIYLLIVKPEGTLTVTYARRREAGSVPPSSESVRRDDGDNQGGLKARLDELAAAHSSGLVTDEEYARKRAEVLERF
jgi:hypothetical protein